MKIKTIDGKVTLEMSPGELKAAHETNNLAADIAQCLYDSMGMNHAIVTCIAVMAVLLHSRHAGDLESFKAGVERITSAMLCSPVAFADVLQTKPAKPN